MKSQDRLEELVEKSTSIFQSSRGAFVVFSIGNKSTNNATTRSFRSRSRPNENRIPAGNDCQVELVAQPGIELKSNFPSFVRAKEASDRVCEDLDSTILF